MNPFDDPDDTFVVLVNDEEQQSLWSSTMAVQTRRRSVRDLSERQDCVEATWTDIRPLSAHRAAIHSA